MRNNQEENPNRRNLCTLTDAQFHWLDLFHPADVPSTIHDLDLVRDAIIYNTEVDLTDELREALITIWLIRQQVSALADSPPITSALQDN